MSRQVFLLPDLGEGLTEAELVRWLVAAGDPVAVDQPVVEVETAKALVEVPSPYAGVVGELHGAVGEVLDVGQPLISVDEPPVEGEPAGSGNVLIGYGTSQEPRPGRGGRRARRRTHPAAPTPVAPGGLQERPRVVSPVVRQLARRTGVDLTSLRGTGQGGLIVRRDVEQAGRTRTTAPRPSVAASSVAAPSHADPRTGLAVKDVVPLTGVRKAAARALGRSRSEIPEATTWVDVDATELVALRASLTTAEQRGPGLLALVGRFVVAGLARFPELNARVDVDGEQIVHLDGVNLGIATQTPRGLVVPAVRDAHRMGARRLDGEIRRLTAAAREGGITAAELTSGSFTLNNYGVLGVDGSAAIINHPEVAMLGMGRVVLKPWVVDGAVVPRSMTQLSLVFDHRVCDGATAGGFLRFVADCVERPLSAFADL